MKTLILTLIITLVSSAFACEQPEAQFIGRISNFTESHKDEATKECYFQIEFSRFNPSGICELDLSEAQAYQFQDYTCTLTNGKPISGILAKKGPFIVIEQF